MLAVVGVQLDKEGLLDVPHNALEYLVSRELAPDKVTVCEMFDNVDGVARQAKVGFAGRPRLV